MTQCAYNYVALIGCNIAIQLHVIVQRVDVLLVSLCRTDRYGTALFATCCNKKTALSYRLACLRVYVTQRAAIMVVYICKQDICLVPIKHIKNVLNIRTQETNLSIIINLKLLAEIKLFRLFKYFVDVQKTQETQPNLT